MTCHSPSIRPRRTGRDRAVERQPGEADRARGGVHAGDVVRVRHVDGQDRDDDLDLVAVALLEGGPQRAVDQARGEDRGLARPALTPEEAAGDLARRVHPLFDVDREREEVDPLAGLGTGAGGEHLGLAVGDDDGAVGELGELAGLHRHVVRADGARHLGDHPVGSSLDSAGARARALVGSRAAAGCQW